MRTRFAPDRGLTLRMVFTMFLLGLLYVVFVGVLFSLSRSIWVAVIIAGAFLGFQYFASDRIALFAMGGKEVTPAEAPELHAIVDRLSAMSGAPKPRVAIADSDMPNAFATGRSPEHAVVCATTGLLRRLDEPEVEAVLAHELAHVAHRDVAVMTIASFLGILAGLITRFAYYSGLFGGFGRDSDDEDGGLPVVLVVMLVSAVVYAISFVLTRALSRYRELAADRAGAVLIGRPSTLASALVKVSGEMSKIPTSDLRSAEPLSAFFFAPALSPGASLQKLLATHPPLEVRLAQLAKIEQQMGRA